MRFVKKFFEKGTAAPLLLVATAFVALAAIFGIAVVPKDSGPDAKIRIEPSHRSVVVGDSFKTRVVVDSKVQVNVFAGELHFDHTVLRVESIDYNISIADLWAETPWYNNGDGTIHFGGGTTKKGGFVGSGDLISVTFRAFDVGEGSVSLYGEKIYLHDGLGTTASLGESGDAVFHVDSVSDQVSSTNKFDSQTKYSVVKLPPTTDLNGDGKQSISDISIFMMNITSDDARYDFNLDGEVNLKDLNVLMGR